MLIPETRFPHRVADRQQALDRIAALLTDQRPPARRRWWRWC